MSERAVLPSTMPKRLPCDATKLTLGRIDAFVLSQIDGRSSVDDLVSLVGLDLAAVVETLKRLVAAGAVDLGETEVIEAVRPRRGAREALSVEVFESRSARTLPQKTAVRRNRIASSHGRAPEPPPVAAPVAPEPLVAMIVAPAADPPAPPASLVPSVPSVPPPVSSDPAMSRRARIRIATGRTSRVSGPVRVAEEVVTVAVPSQRAEAAPPSSRRGDGRIHARVFVEAAELELGRGNFVGASAQFQLALKCAESLEIRRAFEAVEELARPVRFVTHKAQGEAAERDGRWGDASAAYTKARAAKPDDPRVTERLANALRLSSSDLRLAAKLAEEAVQLEPMSAGFRATLAEVYVDAGLDVRAQGELKRALELAPDEPRAKALSAKLAKRDR